MVGRGWVLKARWTLLDLVDFEALAGRGEEAWAVDEGRVRAAVKGLKGAEARPVGKDIETKVLWAVEESLGEVGGGK